MSLVPKKRSPRSKEALPGVWDRIKAQREDGKKLHQFLIVWIRECHLLDEHRKMIESLGGLGVKRRKVFDVTDVIIETVEELFGVSHGIE